MRRASFLALVAVLLLAFAPTAAQAQPGPLAGTVLIPDPVTGQITVIVDDTVTPKQVTALRARAGTVVRHEPGTLSTLIAGGQGIYAGAGRCSLGVNVRQGSTYYFVSAGHCVTAGATWYADAGSTTVLGSRVGATFPGGDYGLVRYTNTAVPHPSAVYTHPGLTPLNGSGVATVGQAVCRSGATTGVRCGQVTALNATVNYAEGRVTGLIRTNICAEPGDSGGPLYVAATGVVLGILSGGSGNCTSGGVSYYQPINRILAAYGVTLP